MRGFLRILGNRRRFSSIKSHEPFKVAFCGNGHFVRAFELSQAALARFPDVVVQQYDPIELEKDIETINVIIPFMTKITPSLINKAKNLKLIIQYGVGLEGVDILAAKEKKISVCKIPSTECANALSCAEHSIFLALSSFRDINGMKNSLLTGRIGFPCGRTLFGSTAVVYGLGGIGRELCVRLHALGVKCHVVVRNLPPPEEINALKERYHFSSLHTKETWNNVSPDADILFFCLTVNESSKNMVDKNFLSNLKPGVVLINVSRGGLFVYDDIYDGLQSGQIGYLAMDVFHTEPFPPPSSDRILSHPRVYSTPHVAGVTELSYQGMAKLLADNIQRIFDGEPLSGEV